LRGLFVTGTDTGAGKTVLSACLLAAMVAASEAVVAHKPVLTGLDEPPAGGAWPRDDELLATVTDMDPAAVAPLRFGPAVSPHLAAELAGRPIDPAALLARARLAATGRAGGSPAQQPALVVEGVGGLMVPLSGTYRVCDLAAELGLGLLIAARPGLGTINHTLLTLQAARAAGLTVLAVVLTPWPQRPDELERSNRETIARLGDVEVAGLPAVGAPHPAALAAAGASLPWRAWLAATGR
jgi:dethiobiotin synthetase